MARHHTGHAAKALMENTSTLVTKCTASFVGQVRMDHVQKVRIKHINTDTVEINASTVDRCRLDPALKVPMAHMRNNLARQAKNKIQDKQKGE